MEAPEHDGALSKSGSMRKDSFVVFPVALRVKEPQTLNSLHGLHSWVEGGRSLN